MWPGKSFPSVQMKWDSVCCYYRMPLFMQDTQGTDVAFYYALHPKLLTDWDVLFLISALPVWSTVRPDQYK